MMWNGRWSRELDTLYAQYILQFGIEPDCCTDLDYDAISYKSYVQMLKKSILYRKPFQKPEDLPDYQIAGNPGQEH